MADRRIIERVAGALGTQEALVEKDWHVVRAIKVIEAVQHEEAKAAFSGGTSLSKGWGLIKRFSEDIDFKIDMPAPPGESRTQGRKRRGAYRKRILLALQESGLTIEGKPEIIDEGNFFSAKLKYETLFTAGQGLREHIRIEMSFQKPALEPVNRPIGSLIAAAQKREPEISFFPCVDPVETAADKLSALAWRICFPKNEDPAVIRHMHDLAAIERAVTGSPHFAEMVKRSIESDVGKTRIGADIEPAKLFAEMIWLLEDGPSWAKEYEKYVLQVSFAKEHEKIGFDKALAATKRLIILV